jgi:hypothetical protein
VPNKTAVAVAAGVVVTGLAVRGVAGYFVGKALAPSEEDEAVYAWSGVGASILLGTLGLGIEAAIALNARK